jgi:hypothetical protein
VESHGAYTPARVERVARTQRRRFLARSGLTVGELTGVELAFLDSWARNQSKIELADAWLAEHGLMDEDGNPRPILSVYSTWINGARCAMRELAAELKRHGRREPSMVAILAGQARRVNGGEHG